MVHIKQLNELLEKHLGSDKTIKNVNMSRLTPPGENFGSIMYKLDVEIHDKITEKEEMLYAVAKTLPDTELYREIFNIQVTYTNEMGFYEVIIPTLQNFQKRSGIEDVIDCFPKCYASRKNLNPGSDVISDDAVLVLENLHMSGYKNADRLTGLDLETSKLILKDIAHLHAVSLALKLKNPEEFKEKVKKYCVEYKTREEMEVFDDALRAVISENPETAEFASKIKCWGSIGKVPPNEPYATFIHQDLWVNNTLQKFEHGKPISNKLVDFQIIDYGSPASDVFFFIWSSVSLSVLKQNHESLLRYYHDNFTTFLIKHGCDTTPFSYENFSKELKAVSEYEIGHSLLFHLFVVNAKKGGHGNEMPTLDYLLGNIPSEAKEKSWYMVKECRERGWLK